MNNKEREERLESKIKEIILEVYNTSVKEILWKDVDTVKLIWNSNYAIEKEVTLVFPTVLKNDMENMSFFNLKKELSKMEMKFGFDNVLIS